MVIISRCVEIFSIEKKTSMRKKNEIKKLIFFCIYEKVIENLFFRYDFHSNQKLCKINM